MINIKAYETFTKESIQSDFFRQLTRRHYSYPHGIMFILNILLFLLF